MIHIPNFKNDFLTLGGTLAIARFNEDGKLVEEIWS
jgi:roadblock/LC7 domain-containing protein